MRDRIVQNAVSSRDGADFRAGTFWPHTVTAFVLNEECRDALRRVDSLLKQDFVYVVDVELEELLRHYSARTPHGPHPRNIRPAMFVSSN